MELGTISSNVQPLFQESLPDSATFESIVIPDKTQYRVFFNKDGTEQATTGVICVQKSTGFEFAEVKGIKPASTDTLVESGKGKYRSPDLTFGDPGIRKHMHRVNINYAPESTIDADMFVRYDYEDKNSTRPAAYPLDSLNVAGIYGSSVYGSASYGGPSQPIVRKSVEGSGFAVALRVEDGATATGTYSLKGFQMEYQLGARR